MQNSAQHTYFITNAWIEFDTDLIVDDSKFLYFSMIEM